MHSASSPAEKIVQTNPTFIYREKDPPLSLPPLSSSSSSASVSTNGQKQRKANKIVVQDDEDNFVIESPAVRSAVTNNEHALIQTNSIHDLKRKPNTTYMYCPSPEVYSDSASPYSTISIIAPSVGMNYTSSGSSGAEKDSWIEVTCQVININIYPSFPKASDQESFALNEQGAISAF